MLFREPHFVSSVIKREVKKVVLTFGGTDLLSRYYECDQFFGPVYLELGNIWSEYKEMRLKLERMIPLFKLEGHLIILNDNICIPREYVREVLQRTHDSAMAGHF